MGTQGDPGHPSIPWKVAMASTVAVAISLSMVMAKVYLVLAIAHAKTMALAMSSGVGRAGDTSTLASHQTLMKCTLATAL